MSPLVGVRLTLCSLSFTCGFAAEAPVANVLEALRSANQARSELARESAAWATERQRLQALIAATNAETVRLERAATLSETARDSAQARLAALGSASVLEAVRAELAGAGSRAKQALEALAARLPPGVMPRWADDESFEAAVRVLEAAEQAAGRIAIEVVTGELGTQRLAVKVLRVAGAAAWWMTLDGSQAGIVTITDGAVILTLVDESGRAAISAALGQIEGRQTPSVVLLPVGKP